MMTRTEAFNLINALQIYSGSHWAEPLERLRELLKDVPEVRDSVIDHVRADLLQRSQFGLKKYGRGIDKRQDIDLRGWLQHQYEELLDAANYVKAAILVMDGKFPKGSDDAA